MPTEARFTAGDIVFFRADPSRVGPIIEVLASTNQATRYKVFHSPTNIAEYYGDQLVPAQVATKGDPLREAASRGDCVSAEVFLARLTAARLAHPLTDTLYALTSARIQFISFQFKPLLRFLRSDRPRLLIADEVGVGKTIEAGLILTELRARQKLNNVLVVCPKALVGKWQKELRRFDERFQIIDSSTFQYCLRETHMEGLWPDEYQKSIISLEVLRRAEHLFGVADSAKFKGLLQLTPPPSFDLLIVDEAHHVRNPGTLSHQSVRFLCDVSTAAIFLSATPVHVGSENLFSLLSLLRADLFPSKDVFMEMMEPARHLLRASRCARSKQPDWAQEVLGHLRSAAGTRWGASVLPPDPLYQAWQARLQGSEGLEDGDRVRCLRDIEELHPLAGVINRTRRRDIGRFTIREPHTVPIDFSPSQQEFYTQLIDFRRRWLLQEYNPLVVRLILDTLERQAASCLPALAATIENLVQGKTFTTESVAEGGEEDEGEFTLGEDLRGAMQELRLLATRLTGEPDPKLVAFENIVEQSVRQTRGPGKILVFSFFLNTLRYLRENLHRQGYRVELITGKVPDLDREELRERFALPRKNPRAIDVLLSSEVGCEGLDYQFCDRMVNYDIPWNPMRIEQRIGRIDRFGQESDKVLIFNFITPGTVEERIFFRCFERLGVFQDTVGDLEGVLGELTQDLSKISMDGSLTGGQKEEKSRQLADNTLRSIEEERRLEEEGQLLLGYGSQVEQDLDDYQRQGRYVDPQELHRMTQLFLRQQDAGCSLTDVEKSGCCRLTFGRKEAPQTLLKRLRELEQSDSVQAFRRFLEQPGKRELTFQQSVAASRREVEFVTPIHPLARLAVQHWEAQREPLVGRMQLPDNAGVVGPLLFLLELWESVGVRKQIQLVGHVWNFELEQVEVEVGDRLVALLAHAVPAGDATQNVAETSWNRAFEALEQGLVSRRRLALEELRKRNQLLVERQSASLDAYYRNRLRQVGEELQQVTEERVVRMKQSERQRLESDQELQRKELSEKREADIIATRVAAGILVSG